MGKNIIEDNVDDDKIYDMIAAGSAILAAVLVKNAMKKGWKRVKHEEPPENPAADDVSWSDAITWTLASGLVLSMAKLLAKRGAAAGYKKIKGKKAPIKK